MLGMLLGRLGALAVCGRLRKSNYFLERVHVPDRSGIRSCLEEREASPPQTATQSHGFASQPRGGQAPPCPGHKTMVLRRSQGGACTPMPRTQSPSTTYTGSALRKPSFWVSGEGGHAPPHTRRKTTVLHRQLRFWT